MAFVHEHTRNGFRCLWLPLVVESASFERFAGVCAISTGLFSFLFSISFIIVRSSSPFLGNILSYSFLTLGGLLATAPPIAIYFRLREDDKAFAVWAIALAIFGAFGFVLYGGYNLAVSIHPSPTSVSSLPSEIDPQGLLSYGMSGIGLFVISALIIRSERFPKGLGYLGYILAAMLVVFFLGRLIIADITNPIVLIPGVLSGFLLDPIWYVWVGLRLLRTS
jgi:hypothetical protein